MRVIIAGTRTASKRDVWNAIQSSGWHGRITTVVSGCCRGADSYGESYAAWQRINVDRHPADWTRHGRAAGPIRNDEMARVADALIAVWDGASRGTGGMIETATFYGIEVFVYRTPAPG